MIDLKPRRPAIADLPLRVVRFSDRALAAGTQTHRFEGVPTQITTPAETVADCIKYRNKIRLDGEMTEFADVPAQYSKGTLKLRQRLDLPEGAEVWVTVSTRQRSGARRGSKRKYQYPTRVVSWDALDRLTGTASLGGDAAADSEALYDPD